MVKRRKKKKKKKRKRTVGEVEDWVFYSCTIVFKTILAFVKSVAVHSIKTFLVFKLMAECAPLIIGGNDKTVLQKEVYVLSDQRYI